MISCNSYGNEEPELKCTVKKTGPPILEPPICEGCTKAREKQERVDSLTYENATVDVIVGEDPKKTPTKSGRYSLRSTRSEYSPPLLLTFLFVFLSLSLSLLSLFLSPLLSPFFPYFPHTSFLTSFFSFSQACQRTFE
jgi:hypothetical protein